MDGPVIKQSLRSQLEIKNMNCGLAFKWIYIFYILVQFMGFPGSSVVMIPPAMQETQEMWVRSLGHNIPWRRAWQPTPVFLWGKSHGQENSYYPLPLWLFLSVLHRKGPFLYLPESVSQDEFTLLPIQGFIHPGISELVVVLWIKRWRR